MTVSERIIQDYLEKGLTMADVPKELKYRLNDKGEMKIYRYMVAHGLIKENPPEPEDKPEPKKPEPKKPEPQQRPVEQPKGDNNTMNTYLSEMRNALSSYYTSAQALMTQKQKNSEIYQAEVAEEQNRGIDAKLSQLYADTWKKLQDAQAAGIAQAEKWGELDGSKITDDIKLLGGHFELKKPQVEALVAKYRGNGTMMEAILKFAKDHGWVPALTIPTVAGKVEAWGLILDHAKTLLDQATNPPAVGWMVGASAAGAVKRQIDRFGTSDVPESQMYAAYQIVEQ